jgi:paraquat-inducible protein A
MTSPAHISRNERECQDCGLFQTLPPLQSGEVACCRRCNANLRHGRPDSLNRTLACAVGAMLLFIVALQLPFLAVSAVGRSYSANLFTGPSMLDARGMWLISVVVVITLIVMPAIQFALLMTVLVGLRLPHPPRFLPQAFGWVERIRPWSMIEVFLLGVFVAYTRLKAIAYVDVGPGLYALGGVMPNHGRCGTRPRTGLGQTGGSRLTPSEGAAGHASRDWVRHLPPGA